VLLGFGFGLRILEPKPAETKPKPWFDNQTKPEHHYRAQATLSSE
jgi:hypothetical protein